MTTGDDYIDHLLDLLSPVGAFLPRRMFGGWGLFLGGVMVGLVWDGRLFFKVDDDTRSRFLAIGAEPFVYRTPKTGKEMEMGYYTPPEEALDSASAMTPWARLAVEAARRAAATKKQPARKQSAKKQPAKKQPPKAANKPRSARPRR